MTVSLQHRLSGPSGAPVIALASSLGADLTMWDPVVERLDDAFRILCFDVRGQGGSPEGAGPCTMADVGADVLELLDTLDLDSVGFAGVSLGGMVGLWLAAHAPERISALAVFCSSACPGAPDPGAWRARAAAVAQAGSVAILAEPVVSRWLTSEFIDKHPDIRDRMLAMLSASPAEGYVTLCEMLADLNLVGELGRISAPTLVVAGAQDTALPPAHSEVIHRGIGGARYECLDPAAHIPMVERPDAVAALIRTHMAPR